MPVRLYEGDKNETGGTGIEVTDNKVINLILRSLNNLIKLNNNNEVYVDLQLEDGIENSDTLPIGVNVGRVLQADGRPVTGTLVSGQTTSGDWIKILYGDDGEIRVDNGTGVWKNITTAYFKTQAEYNSLPAIKTSDGNLYIIVDEHYHLMTPPELLALGTDQAIIDELETHPTEYMEYAVDNNWGILQAYPGVPAGKTCSTGKVYLYGDPNGAGTYLTIITDLTEQEFIDWGVSIGMTEAQAETLRNTTVGKYVMEHTAFPI